MWLGVHVALATDYSVSTTSAEAFSLPIQGLTAKQVRRFAKGHEQFNEAWVVAPEPKGVWGLGPTFNEDRCSHCHRNNGRGTSLESGQPIAHGSLVRLSIGDHKAGEPPTPHPAYGSQLQNRGVDARVPAEGQAIVDYELHAITLSDGEVVELRRPHLRFRDLQFGDLGARTHTSVRIAQQMVGMGLLEWVTTSEIESIAASQPAHGVSGRPNWVWDIENERTVVGRFGWKAGQPSIRQQTATAFHADIGATSYLFPEENCPAVQQQCLDLPSAAKCGGQGGCTGHNYRPEVNPSRLKNITFYLQALAVPRRRDIGDPQVIEGEQIFSTIGCHLCHIPTLTSGADAPIAAGRHVQFHPFTDLLLHDMGEGLADGVPEFEANGREWRTAPLWGIGLLPIVNASSALLHDGRARTIIEAILWHGGEAQAARDAFVALSRVQRDALVRFIRSL